jgi:pimeloyl-ACP methyl ester carboxylesterase
MKRAALPIGHRPVFRPIRISYFAVSRLIARIPAQIVTSVVVAKTAPQAFTREQRATMAPADSRPLLPRIEVPTLVLVGEQDVPQPNIVRDTPR